MIREARAGDAAALAHVHHSSRAEAYADLGENRVMTEAMWDVWLAEDGTRTWLWEDRGAVSGFTSVQGPLLAGLYVLPGAQGQGVGRALLAKAVAEGARELWVYEAHTRARAFYEREGWVPEPDSLTIEDHWRPHAPALRYRLA